MKNTTWFLVLLLLLPAVCFASDDQNYNVYVSDFPPPAQSQTPQGTISNFLDTLNQRRYQDKVAMQKFEQQKELENLRAQHEMELERLRQQNQR
jgi:hypothetical protein